MRTFEHSELGFYLPFGLELDGFEKWALWREDKVPVENASLSVAVENRFEESRKSALEMCLCWLYHRKIISISFESIVANYFWVFFVL